MDLIKSGEECGFIEGGKKKKKKVLPLMSDQFSPQVSQVFNVGQKLPGDRESPFRGACRAFQYSCNRGITIDTHTHTHARARAVVGVQLHPVTALCEGQNQHSRPPQIYTNTPR